MTASLRKTQRFDWRHGAYCLLHVSGALASTLLMSWGLFVLFFLMLGGFHVDGLMHQLHNMTARYITADHERTQAFVVLLAGTQFLLLAGLLLFRRHVIMPDPTGCRSCAHV